MKCHGFPWDQSAWEAKSHFFQDQTRAPAHRDITQGFAASKKLIGLVVVQLGPILAGESVATLNKKTDSRESIGKHDNS